MKELNLNNLEDHEAIAKDIIKRAENPKTSEMVIHKDGTYSFTDTPCDDNYLPEPTISLKPTYILEGTGDMELYSVSEMAGQFVKDACLQLAYLQSDSILRMRREHAEMLKKEAENV